MKLINKTKVPNEVLENLLVSAGRSVGARTSGVVVRVCYGQPLSPVHGRATECYKVRWSGRWQLTDGGGFKMTLPTLRTKKWLGITTYDPTNVAQEFYKIAQHEWGHIKDFQNGGRRTMEFSSGRRRPSHDTRPEEVRAENYVYEAEEKFGKERGYNEIMALAIELEKIQNTINL